ncbi:MAG: histidinol-phosphatase HisJ family protein [Clostridia bacterium]|nr:histidinol-phosphatase HisJ family protein [Clostridia bacterium]
MNKFLTDMHTHSTYSFDGESDLKDMLATAYEKNIAFYGISEHFEYGYDLSLPELASLKPIDEEEYFHAARHLQEDYQGCMNVCVGAEFGYNDEEEAQKRCLETYEKYRPDYVINSVHGVDKTDFAFITYPPTVTRAEVYDRYFKAVRNSLNALYPYDIVGHFGYICRYVPFEDKKMSLELFGEQIDDILKKIIEKDKILEVNAATGGMPQQTLPDADILRRYYQLGGRKISYGSDAHLTGRIGQKREETVAMLKEIGFTYVTVPFRGEHIKVEI